MVSIQIAAALSALRAATLRLETATQYGDDMITSRDLAVQDAAHFIELALKLLLDSERAS